MQQSGEAGTGSTLNRDKLDIGRFVARLLGGRMEQIRRVDYLMQQSPGGQGRLTEGFCWLLGARIVRGGTCFRPDGYIAVVSA
jgi:hypothetical protein